MLSQADADLGLDLQSQREHRSRGVGREISHAQAWYKATVPSLSKTLRLDPIFLSCTFTVKMSKV